MNNSRTAKSIKNSIVSLAFYFVNLIVQFIARRVFLEYLGTEILGLNSTAQNILQFLNLAEMGIGVAAGYFLYKPLRENDQVTINEIVTLQGLLYKRIALLIIIGAFILTPFFPLIFRKIDLPLWYAYISFGCYLFSSLLGYFVNYKQVVLSASQQTYKIQFSYKSLTIIGLIIQIIVIRTVHNPFIWWAIINVLTAIISSVSLRIMTNRTFPYLETSKHSYKQLKYKYPNFTIKIKQIFFHKAAGFVLDQSSTLIIFAYASLTLVAYYDNYMLLFLGVTSLVVALFNSVDAGIGNLVAEGNINNIIRVFKEIFSLRFAISIIICFTVFYCAPLFIKVWIGDKYLLPQSTLILMTIILYIKLFRIAVDSFLYAYGLYSDIYAPMIEALLNLGLSIIFGYYWGLNGILSGVLISLILVVCCWKPYYLFSRGFKIKISLYCKLYIKHLLLGLISWILCVILLNLVNISFCNKTLDLIFTILYHTIVFSCILVGFLLMTKCEIIDTIRRLIKKY